METINSIHVIVKRNGSPSSNGKWLFIGLQKHQPCPDFRNFRLKAFAGTIGAKE
jgi:hypothetical protein